MNIQDEMQNIHHQYGVSEMANYKIEQFIEQLIKDDRAKQSKISPISNCDVCYRKKAALNASLSAIYFDDSSDYKSYHYEVIRSLTGLEEPSEEDIKELFKKYNH